MAASITLASIYLLTRKPTFLSKLVLELGLLGGILLNIIFWLAAGWTSPSTDSLNLLMFLIEAIGFITVPQMWS